METHRVVLYKRASFVKYAKKCVLPFRELTLLIAYLLICQDVKDFFAK